MKLRQFCFYRDSFAVYISIYTSIRLTDWSTIWSIWFTIIILISDHSSTTESNYISVWSNTSRWIVVIIFPKFLLNSLIYCKSRVITSWGHALELVILLRKKSRRVFFNRLLSLKWLRISSCFVIFDTDIYYIYWIFKSFFLIERFQSTIALAVVLDYRMFIWCLIWCVWKL